MIGGIATRGVVSGAMASAGRPGALVSVLVAPALVSCLVAGAVLTSVFVAGVVPDCFVCGGVGALVFCADAEAAQVSSARTRRRMLLPTRGRRDRGTSCRRNL